MRLTDAQRKLLDEITEGMTPDGPGLYIRHPSRWSRTVTALARRGLIEKNGPDYDAGSSTSGLIGYSHWRPTSDG